MAVQTPGRTPAPPRTAASTRLRWTRRQVVEGWVFILPVVVGILAFQLVPVLVSVYASFTNWTGLSSPRFIGLDNYLRMPSDPLFVSTVLNTLYFSIGYIPLSIVIGLVLALLCHGKLRGMRIFRTAFFVPYVVNIVAVSLVWFWFYAPTQGVINGMLSIVIDPLVLSTAEAFHCEVQRFIEFVKSSRTVTPGGEILMPGEIEQRTKARRLRDGIEVDDVTWSQIAAVRRTLGLAK